MALLFRCYILNPKNGYIDVPNFPEVKLNGVLFLLALIAICCIGKTSERKDISDSLQLKFKQDSLKLIEKQWKIEKQRKDSVFRLELIKKSDSLKTVYSKLIKGFTAIRDEFNETEIYRSKRIEERYVNRKTIYALCNSSGELALVSNYFDADWLFHDRVKVKIGDDIFETQSISLSEKGSTQYNEDGNVWENIVYTSNDEIIKTIADDPSKKVLVRFEGKQFYNNSEVSLNDKKSIRETYLLAKCIYRSKEIENYKRFYSIKK